MKIGIITFHSAHNYGAVLQCWSLQEYLKQQGHEVEVVNLRLNVIDKLYYLNKKRTKKITGKQKLDAKINGAWNNYKNYRVKWKDPQAYEKFIKFEKFINETLPVTAEVTSFKKLCQLNLKYDAVIVGSDQVWNGPMMNGIDPSYFLQFANKDALKISYAASIGTDEIPPQFKEIFRRYLRDFDAISVRESRAKAQVEELTDQEVALVADPTFLLKKEDFDRIKEPARVSEKYIYVHNVHLKRVDESLNRVAEFMSQKLNLPIVHNWKKKVYKHEAGHFTGGIGEFIGMVEGAEFVITNSFHCTVFSIIYHKNFITVPHFKNPDRMRFLLSQLGIPEHLVQNTRTIPEDMADYQIDFDQVEEKKAVMRTEAQTFLTRALSAKKHKDDRNYFDYKDEFRCYGCTACEDVCPVGAITMEEDRQGYLYPVVDDTACTSCGKCRNVCIYHKKGIKNKKQEQDPDVFAVYAKDEAIHKAGSSGGVFTPLAMHILAQGGSVVGVTYDEELNVVYRIAKNAEEVKGFRGSKYIMADSRGIKTQVKELLDAGDPVLFSGTPCQIAGLKSYLGKTYDNLYTVEIVCSGAGSPKVFRKYRESLEEQYQSKLVRFEFDNQFKGAKTPFVLAEFASGSVDIEQRRKNNLGNTINNHRMDRPSCFVCEYAGSKSGVADLTIGDFKYKAVHVLLPEFAHEDGVSFVKVNTEHGRALLKAAEDAYVMTETSFKDAYKDNCQAPTVMYTTRCRLMYFLDDYPVDDVLLKYNSTKKAEARRLKLSI